VRLLDFHNDAHQDVHVMRPAPNGRVYVRRVDDDAEFAVPASPSVIALADLDGAPARVASRGAANEAFASLFALPFDQEAVNSYVEPVPESWVPLVERDAPQDRAVPASPPNPATARRRRILGWTGVGFGAAAVGVGGILSATSVGVQPGNAPNNADVASRNNRVTALNTGAAVAYTVGGVSVATGLFLLLWPGRSPVQVVATPAGGYVGYSRSF
jgi:hypothetical protein